MKLWASALTLFLLGVRGLAAPADTNFFPIMAWNWAPNDPVVLNNMRACGLTIAGFVAPGTLDACRAAGLKAIVSDARTSDYDWANVDEPKARIRVASLVADVGNHPALFGYYLRDEPSTTMFPGLAKVASLVRELAPGKWPYLGIQLTPPTATGSVLTCDGRLPQEPDGI